MRKDVKTIPSSLSKDHLEQVERLRLPAEKTVIISILTKLAVHKRMENDVNRQAMLFKDYADLLYGQPEYAIIEAVLHLIEYDTDPYFPPLAVITEVIETKKIPGEAIQIVQKD